MKQRFKPPEYEDGKNFVFLCNVGPYDVFTIPDWPRMVATMWITNGGSGWYVYRHVDNPIVVQDRDALFTQYAFTEDERAVMEAILTMKGL